MTYEIDKVPQVVIDEVHRLHGFYVGMLSAEEADMFQLCVDAGGMKPYNGEYLNPGNKPGKVIDIKA